jgi:hypothetical protein
MPSTEPPVTATAVHEPDATLFAALELSLSRWVVVASAPGESKTSKHTLPACDGPALLALLDGLRRQAERRFSHAVTVVTREHAKLWGADVVGLRPSPTGTRVGRRRSLWPNVTTPRFCMLSVDDAAHFRAITPDREGQA